MRAAAMTTPGTGVAVNAMTNMRRTATSQVAARYPPPTPRARAARLRRSAIAVIESLPPDATIAAARFRTGNSGAAPHLCARLRRT